MCHTLIFVLNKKTFFTFFWPFFETLPSTKLLKLSVYFFNELAFKSAFQPSTYSLIPFFYGRGGTPPANLYIFRHPVFIGLKGLWTNLKEHSRITAAHVYLWTKRWTFYLNFFFSCGRGLSPCCWDTGFTVYQVLVEQEDIQKTAIITPSGMFEFLVMPFGLRNISNT